MDDYQRPEHFLCTYHVTHRKTNGHYQPSKQVSEFIFQNEKNCFFADTSKNRNETVVDLQAEVVSTMNPFLRGRIERYGINRFAENSVQVKHFFFVFMTNHKLFSKTSQKCHSIFLILTTQLGHGKRK